jgi:hypothetical protein
MNSVTKHCQYLLRLLTEAITTIGILVYQWAGSVVGRGDYSCRLCRLRKEAKCILAYICLAGTRDFK